jgi:hypothetical protein
MREVGYPEGTKKFHPSSRGRAFVSNSLFARPPRPDQPQAATPITIIIYNYLQPSKEALAARSSLDRLGNFGQTFTTSWHETKVSSDSGLTVHGIYKE